MRAEMDLKEKVKSFWNEHPLCSYEIKEEPGTLEFFERHNSIREEVEKYAKGFCEFESSRNLKLLDIGCGTGWVVCEYARHGAEVTGIDLTEAATLIARKRLQLYGLNADIKEADAENLPFEDESFDMVTSMGVLHHTPDTQKALDEIHRVLRKNGKFIISLYYKNILLRDGVFPVFIRLLKLLKVGMHGIKDLKGNISLQEFINYYDGKDNPLGKAYSYPELKNMLGKFKNLEMEPHYFPVRFLPFRKLIPETLVRLPDKYLGFLVYVKGQKA